jgi:hypothetical protein
VQILAKMRDMWVVSCMDIDSGPPVVGSPHDINPSHSGASAKASSAGEQVDSLHLSACRMALQDCDLGKGRSRMLGMIDKHVCHR